MKEALSSVNLVPPYQVILRHKIVMGRNYLHSVHTSTEGCIRSARTQWWYVSFVVYFLFLSMNLCIALGILIRALY
jgi:hypothetical protein